MRHARAAFAVVLLGLPGAGFADAPAAAPLAEQHLNVDGLNAWGTRTYSMIYCKPGGDPSSEQSVGRMTLTCESKEGLVKFVNVTRTYLPDGVRFIELNIEARAFTPAPTCYPPRKCVSTRAAATA
ncbi:MAG: hypothetical protein JW809_03360 [Pirellulales bacterium]|nr:hypothetical protein [Pirellulales bacterium]